MERIAEEKSAVNVLIEGKAVCLLGFLNVILLCVIIVLAVQVIPVRNIGDERITDDERITIINEARRQYPVPCEDDWIWSRGKCYYFSKQRDTWDNSQKFCISHNASLALIENQEELNFLVWIKGLDNHWIGLRRTDDNKAWVWTNGSLYNGSLFAIQKSSQENVERVFLNHDGVRSNRGAVDYRWICNKQSFLFFL